MSNSCSIECRFGFNGQEKTDEVSGAGNHLDFKYRGYDPRTGRFWSVDPLFKDYPWNSTYCFAENDVIRSKDLEGAEKLIVTTMVHPNGVKITTSTEQSVAGILGEGTLYRLIDVPKGALGASYTENGVSSSIPFNYAFPEFNAKQSDGGDIRQGYTRTEKFANGAKKFLKALGEDGSGPGDPSFGGCDITKKDLRSLANGLESTGRVVNLIGTGDSFVAPPLGAEIITAGETINAAGTITNVGLDLYEGNTKDAAISIGAELVGRYTGTVINKDAKGLIKNVTRGASNESMEQVKDNFYEQKK
ncbi:MAG: hypothetical protein HXX18_06985 [Bacteroidetes bacterium]|nr:hypothetical protein [Bacteroidota bacterium]